MLVRWGKCKERKRGEPGTGERREEVTPSFPWDKKEMIVLPEPSPHIQRVDLIFSTQSLGKVQKKKSFPT